LTERVDPSAVKPARILIVDDEPLNVDYLEQELECHGFLTESAANGLEALERVAASPPDLVLLDVMMPELDGIAALRVLKQDPETRLIPVVLMTALNAVDDRVRGIEAGADDFLSKPVDDRELIARIRTALKLKQAIDETVSELRNTTAHLEEHGRQRREVVVLALVWRSREPQLPDEVAAFVRRRERVATEQRIQEFGGTICSGDADLLAVFDDAAPAVDAALAAAEHDESLVFGAAISRGVAEVGSLHVGGRWVYGADGEPVARAVSLARNTPGVVVSGEAAADLADLFDLQAAEGGALRVLGRTEGATTRRIRTILVTDIVGSTSVAERIGDRAWTELLAAHEAVVRQEIVGTGGEVVDTAGDGFLAVFDGPAKAIRCALAIHPRLAELGLSIRAGVNTGEIEELNGRPTGIALNIAARIADRAAAGEVLVSSTTRELAAGSGLVFVDRGDHAMKGLSEARRLYAAFVDPVQATAAKDPFERATDYPAGLTSREADVLRLIALGLTDAQAAEHLYLSVRTVNAHLRSIYRKLGIGSRADAARFAREHGIA
jgi:DNA-binding NarL/FixJ family response regulator